MPKFNFWKGDWALGYSSILIWDFSNSPAFPKILSLKSFGNSWGNSYTNFIILDIKFRFTCAKWDLYWNTVKFQNTMTRIIWKFSFCSVLFQWWFQFLEIVLIWLRKVSSIKYTTNTQSWKLSKVKFLLHKDIKFGTLTQLTCFISLLNIGGMLWS